MMNREENLKKIVGAVEKIFADKGIEIPSEIVQQVNEKFETLSDEQVAKAASEENLQKMSVEIEKNFAAENFAEIRDLSDDEMEQVAGGWNAGLAKVGEAVVKGVVKLISWITGN